MLNAITTISIEHQFQVDAPIFLWCHGRIEKCAALKIHIAILDDEKRDVTNLVKNLDAKLFDRCYQQLLGFALDDNNWGINE